MMFRCQLTPSGLEWNYHPVGQCPDAGCPGGCIHVITGHHHMLAEDHAVLVKAFKAIAEFLARETQTKLEITSE